MVDSIHRTIAGVFVPHLWQAAKLFADDTEFAKSLMDRTVYTFRKALTEILRVSMQSVPPEIIIAVVNNAMMAMYQCSKDVKYLGYVERNLNMMMYYIEPNDMVFYSELLHARIRAKKFSWTSICISICT